MLLNKLQAKVLSWVQQAKETPSKGKGPIREILTGIYFEKDTAIAADGFRLFAAKDAGLPDLAGRTVDLGKINQSTSSVEVVNEPEGTFPHYPNVMPTHEPILEVYVDPKFLREALTGLSGNTVRLVFYGEDRPMEVYGQIDGMPVYALIMPRNQRYSDSLDWRPGR